MKTLRYGKVMIMTDQDQDGSHIKGLLINFIHHNWPDLLQMNFLEEFITPIVKATKKNEEHCFYSLPEFEEWRTNTPNNHTYNIKYYKGIFFASYMKNVEIITIDLFLDYNQKIYDFVIDWHLLNFNENKKMNLNFVSGTFHFFL